MSISRFLVLFACFHASCALGQAPDTAEQVRPNVTPHIDVLPRTQLQLFGELQNGENYSFQRWKGGTLLNRRMQRILKRHRRDIDDENEYGIVIGAGYEYEHTVQNGSTKIENRIVTQATFHYVPGAAFLLTDRNRVEFRWVNGAYDFRYRNKLMVNRPLELHHFRFTPYASGEMYYDRNHHAWDQNEFGPGVQFPYKQRLMLDVYYLRQNCSSCNPSPVNIWGLTLNIYFRKS
jgi:hypothetical protein